MNAAANLLRMVEQIAGNLQHEVDPSAAVIDHLKTFWSPEMLAMLATIYPRSDIADDKVAQWLVGQFFGTQ